jgi:IS4 transposase
VLADEVISFYGLPGEGREYFFRRVEIFDAEQQRRLVFLSNHLQFGPTTLAAIYKERWQVELFFKALKQLCKIKTFIGTSANAVKVQVWTALIAMLLLRLLQLRARFGWALFELAGSLTSAVVCASRPVDLAGRSFPASPSAPGRATATGPGLSGTAEARFIA